MSGKTRNSRRLSLSLTAAGLMLASSLPIAAAHAATAGHLTVSNPLNSERHDEVIEVPLADVLAHDGNGAPENVIVRDGRKTLVTQLIDEDGSGKPDHLLILADFAPKQTRHLTLTTGSAPTPPAEPRVFGRFAPERKDDFAWESDKIAFRIYGPALQKTGEVSSGLDVWSKRVPKLVINEWYAREAAAAKIGKEAVHKDAGTGLDCYKVGPTLGCGGVAVWDDGKLVMSKNYTDYKVIANGPIRFVVDLTYAPWDALGTQVSEVKRITLDAGSHLNKLRDTFTFSGRDTLPIAAGVYMHPEGAGAKLTPPQPGYEFASIWEPADLHAGMMSTGIVMPPGAEATFKEADKHALYIRNAKSGVPLTHYAGAGWSKYDVPDHETWQKLLKDFDDRLKHPLAVKWE